MFWSVSYPYKCIHGCSVVDAVSADTEDNDAAKKLKVYIDVFCLFKCETEIKLVFW